MALDISRRSLFLGGLLTLSAPAVVRASSIMSIKDPRLVRGIYLNRQNPAFVPLENDRESRHHDVVWLRNDDALVREYCTVAAQTDTLTGGASIPEWAYRAGTYTPGALTIKRPRRKSSVDFALAVQASLRGPRIYVTDSVYA